MKRRPIDTHSSVFQIPPRLESAGSLLLLISRTVDDDGGDGDPSPLRLPLGAYGASCLGKKKKKKKSRSPPRAERFGQDPEPQPEMSRINSI